MAKKGPGPGPGQEYTAASSVTLTECWEAEMSLAIAYLQ